MPFRQVKSKLSSHAASTDPGYSGVTSTLTATITDNDIPGVTLSSTSLTILEGLTEIYTAVLDLPPLADVVVNLAPGPSLAVSRPTLTFTFRS